MEKCLIFIFLSLFLLLVSSPFGEKKTYERKDVTVCKEKNQYDVALDEDAYANSQSLSSSPLLSLYLLYMMEKVRIMHLMT
ncbi:hypothetical protein JCM9140_1481 [Halalkalibacter wakoensis JCM 9140]|uniref:Uncharacterized protein n=1 Tax=Halalkalibacter wakoensis JCM 9140 TaxID=1236970 RepID=W4Q1A8_9BACI|nr:hypothetical protein [Halalkalibacter wakoensis]GAE25483.1 hypothetical protein JCM9140_1481 [Halalkalibacter wakoensis JCM 9140]